MQWDKNHTLQCFIAAKVNYIVSFSMGIALLENKEKFCQHTHTQVCSAHKSTPTVNIKSMQLCNDSKHIKWINNWSPQNLIWPAVISQCSMKRRMKLYMIWNRFNCSKALSWINGSAPARDKWINLSTKTTRPNTPQRHLYLRVPLASFPLRNSYRKGSSNILYRCCIHFPEWFAMLFSIDRGLNSSLNIYMCENWLASRSPWQSVVMHRNY